MMFRPSMTLVGLVAALALAAPAQAQDELPPVESGVVKEQATINPSRAAGTYYTQTWTAFCQQKNAVGMILWRYNSRWTWTYGGKGNVVAADHTEWGSHTNLGWRYVGSRYLEAYGAIGTQKVGRTTQGTFNFEPGGTFIRSRTIRLRVIVGPFNGIDPDCLD